jgi:hypothetical protein
MSLEEDEVAAVVLRRAVPEVVEAHVVEVRCRGEARDVAADVGVLVRAQHHRHRVPAHVRADAMLDLGIARQAHLLVDGDGVDVRGVGRERQVRAALARRLDQALDELVRAVGALDGEHGLERFDPFAGLLRVGIASLGVHSTPP